MTGEITGRDILLACAEVLAIAVVGALFAYWWFRIPL